MWFSPVVLVLVTLILVVYEFFGIYLARRKRLTKNASRLITHTLMILLLVILLAQIIFFGVQVLTIK